jgi:hypothetical protein
MNRSPVIHNHTLTNWINSRLYLYNNIRQYEKHVDHVKTYRHKLKRQHAEEFGLVNENKKLQEKFQRQKLVYQNFAKGGKFSSKLI